MKDPLDYYMQTLVPMVVEQTNRGSDLLWHLDFQDGTRGTNLGRLPPIDQTGEDI